MNVPKFAAEPKEDEHDSDESFYDLENIDNENKDWKPSNENEGKPLKLSDLKFLKLMVQEVKIQS